MPWLSSADDSADSDGNGRDKKKDLIDLTQLGAGDNQGDVDTGITSGSDPSSWDPIDIENPH